MPGRVHQMANHIGIFQGDVSYVDTPENFAIDRAAPPPLLDENLTERLYDQELRHALIVNHDVVDGGPMPWPEGDELISQLPALRAKQALRVESEWQEKAKAFRDAQEAEAKAMSEKAEEKRKLEVAAYEEQAGDRKAQAEAAREAFAQDIVNRVLAQMGGKG
jgi:hypothetical protein